MNIPWYDQSNEVNIVCFKEPTENQSPILWVRIVSSSYHKHAVNMLDKEGVPLLGQCQRC